MADGKMRSNWDHTAQICATIANANRDKKSRPIEAAVFHPYYRMKKSNKFAATKENLMALKPAIMAMKNRKPNG